MSLYWWQSASVVAAHASLVCSSGRAEAAAACLTLVALVAALSAVLRVVFCALARPIAASLVVVASAQARAAELFAGQHIDAVAVAAFLAFGAGVPAASAV